VDNAQNRRNVGQAMQELPPLRPESPDHPVRRCNRKRHHEGDCDETDLKEATTENFFNYARQIECSIKPEVNAKMQSSVEETLEAKRSTVSDQAAPTEEHF